MRKKGDTKKKHELPTTQNMGVKTKQLKSPKRSKTINNIRQRRIMRSSCSVRIDILLILKRETHEEEK